MSDLSRETFDTWYRSSLLEGAPPKAIAWAAWQASHKQALEDPKADDIRALGWTVAVHNDYRLNSLPHTFWLFTKGAMCVKGEGRTDAEALKSIIATLKAAPQPPVDESELLSNAVMEHLGPAALTGGKMSILQAFELGWKARSEV